jgi:hypothetical protein
MKRMTLLVLAIVVVGCESGDPTGRRTDRIRSRSTIPEHRASIGACRLTATGRQMSPSARKAELLIRRRRPQEKASDALNADTFRNMP